MHTWCLISCPANQASSSWSYAASCSHPTASLLWECCTCCTARSNACLASSSCQINIRKQWHACIPPQNILSCLNYHIPVILLHILKGVRTKVLLKAARNATHPPAHTSVQAGWESGRIWELRAVLCRLKYTRAVSSLTPSDQTQPSTESSGPPPARTNAAPRQAAPPRGRHSDALPPHAQL